MDVARAAGDYLKGRGVPDGRLDAEHLLAGVLGMKRLELYLHHDRPLGETELAAYRSRIRRRGAREPLQYVLGSAPFRDLRLRVDGRVAIPRPETEFLLDVVARATGRTGAVERALDVGTGSGAIALALATEGGARRVVATDVSPAALSVARDNARRTGAANVDFRLGSLLAPVEGETFDLVLCNPPYLGEAEWASAEPEVREWEPRLAMVSGADGLDAIRALAVAAPAALRSGGWLGLEIGAAQGPAVERLLRDAGGWRDVAVHNDLTGRCRYVVARKAGRDRERASSPSHAGSGRDRNRGRTDNDGVKNAKRRSVQGRVGIGEGPMPGIALA